MIDPREIRIGNLVTDAFGENVIEVESISKDGINLQSLVLTGLVYTPMSQIFGIQLNHKVLTEWFGLENSTGSIYKSPGFVIYKTIHGIYDLWITLISGDRVNLGSYIYVHDLQNCLYDYKKFEIKSKPWILQS